MSKPNILDRLFLTQKYLDTLTDDQIGVRCLGSDRWAYHKEKGERAFQRAMAEIKASTERMHAANLELQIRNQVREEYQDQVDALFSRVLELNRELGEQDDELAELRENDKEWQRKQKVSLSFIDAWARLCHHHHQRADEFLAQVDELREERNQLLDICHDYEQALKAVAPKAE